MKPIHHGQNVKEMFGFAQSLRYYVPKFDEKMCRTLKKELKKWKKIESITLDNFELNQAQKEIARLEREVRRASKNTIDAYQKKYQELRTKFKGFTMYCEETDRIILRYVDGGFNATSKIIRKDADKLFDELVCPSI
jgi:hypothetical protein